MNAETWIKKLKLGPHPEGGYYRETYRSAETLPLKGLPARFKKPHALATAIYYLLRAGDFSAFHRLKSDELWHYHAGSSLRLFCLEPDGDLRQEVLGPGTQENENPQIVIPAGVWFAAKPEGPEDYVLSSCTVSPGFEFEDFEIGTRKGLLEAFPQHRGLIETLARTTGV